MVRDKTPKEVAETFLQAGSCRIIIDKDEKGRYVLTPACPRDEQGQPALSDELKILNDVLRSAEVVLRPPRLLEEPEKA